MILTVLVLLFPALVRSGQTILSNPYLERSSCRVQTNEYLLSARFGWGVSTAASMHTQTPGRKKNRFSCSTYIAHFFRLCSSPTVLLWHFPPLNYETAKRQSAGGLNELVARFNNAR